jgi:hypothetical protein
MMIQPSFTSPINRFFLVVVAVSFSFFVNAKSKMDMRIDMNKIGFTSTIDASADYKEAEILVTKALEKLSQGEVNAADLLIYKSINQYPTKAVFKYVEAVCLMPDINKANAIMDELFRKVQSVQDEKLLVLEPFAISMENGKWVAKVKEYEKERALFNFGYEEYKINKAYGGIKYSLL